MEIDWEKIARAELHPLQAKIIDTMGDGGEWSATKIAREFDVPRPNVFHHPRRLREMGIVREVRAAPNGGGLEHFHVLVVWT